MMKKKIFFVAIGHTMMNSNNATLFSVQLPIYSSLFAHNEFVRKYLSRKRLEETTKDIFCDVVRWMKECKNGKRKESASQQPYKTRWNEQEKDENSSRASI